MKNKLAALRTAIKGETDVQGIAAYYQAVLECNSSDAIESERLAMEQQQLPAVRMAFIRSQALVLARISVVVARVDGTDDHADLSDLKRDLMILFDCPDDSALDELARRSFDAAVAELDVPPVAARPGS